MVDKSSFLMSDQAVAEANRGRFRTVGEVRDWIADTFEMTYWEHSIYTLLQCLGLRLKVPAAAVYLDGLLSNTRRKNSWQLTETAGDAMFYGSQNLLGRAVWPADAARDELCAPMSLNTWGPPRQGCD